MLNVFAYESVCICVCPQRVTYKKGCERPLAHQSSDSLLDGVAVTEA